MKFFRTLLIAVVLVPVVSFATSAFAASNTDRSESTIVTGTVLEIDRSARVLVVSGANGQITKVHVPEGRRITLSRNGNVWAGASSVEFERAHVGLRVRMITE